MRILGISAFYHDSAAALVDDGRIVAAAQEERFTRKKHDARFPRQAVEYCLREGGITLDELDHIVFYDKPFLKFERLLETYLAFAPRGLASFSMAVPLWIKEKLFQKLLLKRELEALGKGTGLEAKLLFAEHHQSHAASAFFPSPFSEAAVLTMDGVGEWATTSMGIGRGNSLEVLKEIHFPHSLGLLYSAFTYYAGFRVNSGEHKLMGLAPYGEPKFVGRILDRLIDVKPAATPLRHHAIRPESQGQASGVVPPVRAVGARGGSRQVVRPRCREPLHAHRGRRGPSPPARHEPARAAALRHRQAERSSLHHSRRHPRRLLGAHPDRASRDQSEVSRALDLLPPAHRMPDPRQHELQREGEPIVGTPEDAFRCFMGTDIDVLAIGNCFLRKEDQDPQLTLDDKGRFAPD